MNSDEVIDLGREAINVALLVGGPILIVSLLIGIGIGMLQAMTQVQDQSVSFVPKLMGMLLAIGLALPWLASKMVEYTEQSLATPPFGSVHTGEFKTTRFASFEKGGEKEGGKKEGLPNSLSDRDGGQVELRPSVSSTDSAEQPQVNPLVPDKSPFQLPHYRYSRLPKEDQEL